LTFAPVVTPAGNGTVHVLAFSATAVAVAKQSCTSKHAPDAPASLPVPPSPPPYTVLGS
jgi:hypothetical protein